MPVTDRILESLRIVAEAAGFGQPVDPIIMIARLVRTFLSFTGVIFLSLVIFGGFLWMTSGGNEEKVARAKRVLTQAVVGLIIIFSAYALAVFVMDSLLKATGAA